MWPLASFISFMIATRWSTTSRSTGELLLIKLFQTLLPLRMLRVFLWARANSRVDAGSKKGRSPSISSGVCHTFRSASLDPDRDILEQFFLAQLCLKSQNAEVRALSCFDRMQAKPELACSLFIRRCRVTTSRPEGFWLLYTNILPLRLCYDLKENIHSFIKTHSKHIYS